MLQDEESTVFVAHMDTVHRELTPWCEELNVNRTLFVRKIHRVPLMYKFFKLNEQATECFTSPPSQESSINSPVLHTLQYILYVVLTLSVFNMYIPP